ncbi:MAG TPA: 6,7-dimethyl-8-ribityllumazine synthase [Tepidisphaeraceae bacterium]|jgi:6,7-dimethyl-8-ribityllumazine synthase
MSLSIPEPLHLSLPRSTRIAIAAARFNADIVDQLLSDCVNRLEQNGIAMARIDVQRVPGSFELPVAAQAFAATGRYAAVIALGAVIRGETPHFDLVAANCATGLREVGLKFSLPVIFGVLATNDQQQALSRTRGPHSRSGINAADAACEMIAVLGRIKRHEDQHGARKSWPAVKTRKAR